MAATTKQEPATMIDMDAGWVVEGHMLHLQITVDTKSPDERKKVADAIQKAIEDCGHRVEWVPLM